MIVNNRLISSNFIKAGNLNIHYLTAGVGKPVVLLHGWPTSSYLWRKVVEPLADTRTVIVPDLAGFGQSDKPLDAVYTHNFHAEIFDDFLDRLGIEKTSLIVHDIGAPIGLLWAVRNQDRLERLVILNTLFYPDGSCRLFYTHKISLLKRFWSIIFYPKGSLLLKFILLTIHTPGLRNLAFSSFGISQIMKMGVENKEMISREVVAAYQSPFDSATGRQLLNKTFLELQLDELEEIVQKLHTLKVPVYIVYGEKDSILPGLAAEMHRLQHDLPDARLAAIPECGHYLQEDKPQELSSLLVRFLAE